MQKLLHTPEGVRDIYSGECEQKLALQEKSNHSVKALTNHHIKTYTDLTIKAKQRL